MDGLILTEEELRREVEYFLTKDAFAWDTETMDGDNPETRARLEQNRIVWISLATYGRTIVIPMGHPNGDVMIQKSYRRKNKETGLMDQFPFIYSEPPKQLKPSVVFEILRPLFFHPTIKKIAHNATFDLGSSAKYFGAIPCGPNICTMVCQWLLNEEIGASDRALLGPPSPRGKGLKILTKWYYGVDYDKEEVGRCVEKHPFSKVARYSLLDVRYTWLLYLHFKSLIEAEDLEDIWNVEIDTTDVCAYMDLQGAYLDLPQVMRIRDDLNVRLEKCEAEVYRAAGKIFNINSVPQKQVILYGPKEEGNQGLTTRRKTRNGNLSTDREALEAFEGNAVVDALLAYSEVNKLLSTYINAYIGRSEDSSSILYKGRVHSDLVQYGTVTGRFSCVSGDTLLTTNRGTFTMYEYIPEVGDTVRTHTGEQHSILRKIYKGLDQMFEITLANGAQLKCTLDHRVLTPSGWSRIGDLTIGDEVLSYVDIEELYEQSRECTESTGVISYGWKAHIGRYSQNSRNNLPERSIHYFLTPEGSAPGREGFEIFPVEAGKQESNVREDWRTASQLHWGCVGRQGISDPGSSREEVFLTQSNNGRSSEYSYRESSREITCTSYRSESFEQFTGQSGSCDSDGACRDPFTNDRASIRSIVPLGTAPVWDIEVEGDHSYVTHGFLNHNSRNPNLQNVPHAGTELGKLIRGMFAAPEGYKLLVADYGQMELRILASYIGHGGLYEGFLAGIDAHTQTAALVYGVPVDQVEKYMRKAAKTLNFAIVYGAGPDKVARMLGVSLKEAKKLLADHERAFPEIYAFKKRVVNTAAKRATPHIKTILGRTRRLWDINHPKWGPMQRSHRQAVNSLIQGSLGDIIKLAMVRMYRLISEDSLKNPGREIKMILSVHDELVLEVPEDRTEEASAMLREAMTGKEIQDLLRVPVDIGEIAIVDNWADAKD